MVISDLYCTVYTKQEKHIMLSGKIILAISSHRTSILNERLYCTVCHKLTPARKSWEKLCDEELFLGIPIRLRKILWWNSFAIANYFVIDSLDKLIQTLYQMKPCSPLLNLVRLSL
jgi:hypothetical protein